VGSSSTGGPLSSWGLGASTTASNSAQPGSLAGLGSTNLFQSQKPANQSTAVAAPMCVPLNSNSFLLVTHTAMTAEARTLSPCYPSSTDPQSLMIYRVPFRIFSTTQSQHGLFKPASSFELTIHYHQVCHTKRFKCRKRPQRPQVRRRDRHKLEQLASNLSCESPPSLLSFLTSLSFLGASFSTLCADLPFSHCTAREPSSWTALSGIKRVTNGSSLNTGSRLALR
jgi:hypothetical protein